MAEPRLIIKQQKPLIWHVASVALIIAALLMSYFGGRYFAIEEQNQVLEKADWLENELNKFKDAYKQTNEELVMQIQTAKVDDQSNQQLVDMVKRLQDFQRQLESELSFYRKIMAPEKDQEGLTIDDFILTKNVADNSSHFKLVLTQAGKQDQFLKGEVELLISGILEGAEKVFSFRELGTFKKNDFQFQFRYFQNIEGELSIPQGFDAKIISIKATTSGLRKNQTAEKQINWNS